MAKPPPTTDRNRALAVHHATLLQSRKDTQSIILESLETLIDFPTNPTAARPEHPSPADLAAFRAHVAPFQVSDYDALIEERNAAGNCGYVFCPRPFAPDAKTRGSFRIIWGSAARGQGLKVVPANEIRRWCSVRCAQRAMYVKVQLNEAPAWERAGGLGNKVDVLPEDDEETFGKLTDKIKGMNLSEKSEEDALKDAMAELAIERGDTGIKSSARTAAFADITVKEKQDTGQARPPEAPSSPGQEQKNHLEIEGYAPRTTSDTVAGAESDKDFDWVLT